MWTARRQKKIDKLLTMANDLAKNYTWDGEMKIWDECSDWNRKHEDEEIAMCEVAIESEYVNGFMIEDYVFTFDK